MDRFTYAVVGGVLALVVTGLAVAALARGRETPPDLTTPSGVALAYALAEQRGDGQAAWELLATSAQARSDRDRFIARVTTNGVSEREYLSTDDERIEADGQNASVLLVRAYSGSGGIFGSSSYTNRTTVRVTRELDRWRITVPPDDYALTSK
jgi:hypothetical protein